MYADDSGGKINSLGLSFNKEECLDTFQDNLKAVMTHKMCGFGSY